MSISSTTFTCTTSTVNSNLRMKKFACDAKWRDAAEALAACRIDEETLYAEWEKQVQAQTKPLPRQWKNQGKVAVEEVLCLQKSRDALRDKVSHLRNLIINTAMTAWDVATYELELQSAKEGLQKMELRVAKKEKSLGASANDAICHLLNSNYLNKRMNALALLMQVREHLRLRKFELDRLEHSYRKQRSEQRINEHTQDSVRQWEPAIAVLARKYNALCEDMRQLIDQHKAPHSAIAPKLIDLDNLFNLDVDNDIWLDISLSYDDDAPPPLWLSDENVRTGIRSLLDRDRCEEERKLLQAERDSMQEWFSEEWHVMQAVLQTQDPNTKYQFETWKQQLCRLYTTWERAMVGVPASRELPGWGPLEHDILEARSQVLLGGGIEVADEDVFNIEFEAEADELLTEHLDSLRVMQNY
ncbi:hypothetical protein GYMLUDRAFT_249302 [Collybiopsis luxurians FD-317 M1]|uniref:Uncharacterized protein n=1 Tax=Collybiopsis luxurians FD-317 M1 TaxID=944289 RepID=A0A0D0C9E2_9AGAR|nr:hypothetical protein GYMLUDRAFT_249302 [Collybiopsis luxurians FD-317 M1]